MTNIVRLLPDSLKRDPFTVALVQAFEREITELYEEFALYALLHVADNLPEELIDFLAFEKHVDFYQDLSLQEKRNVVKNSIAIHRKKGTKYALLRIFDLLNLKGSIDEWFEYEGEPYYFKGSVEVSEKSVSEETIQLLEKLIHVYKNNRSWLESLNVYLTSSKNNFFVASNLIAGEEITIFPYSITNITVQTKVTTASAEKAVDITTIYPGRG